MPIQITGLFAPSGGPGSFNLYSPEDIDPGSVDVVLQLIAGGGVRGGSHASSPAGELVVQRKTTTGAPTHSATEGTLCWVTVDDVLYCNNNGATGWTAVGTSTQAAAATPSPPGRDGEDGGDAGYRITGPFGPVGGDLRRELPYPNVHRASEDFALTGDITPTALAAQANNYNPTGLATATVLRMTKTGAQNISGLAGGFDGRIVVFVDIDAADSLTFLHESGSSSAANQFFLPEAKSYTLAPGNAVAFRYDATSSRWRTLTAMPTGTLKRIVSYTSGSGTHTTFPGCRKQVTRGVGGGGGGGGSDTVAAGQSAAAGGGSGAGYTEHEDDSPPATVAYTVGAGGAGGTAGPNNGSNGTGSTWVASSGTVTSAGGLGGNGGVLSGVALFTQGGSATNPTGANRVNASGTGGLPGMVLAALGPCLGGQGGNAGGGFGGGGTPRLSTGVGNAGFGYGSGGSGAVSLAATGAGAKAGGAGKDGIILVAEYL